MKFSAAFTLAALCGFAVAAPVTQSEVANKAAQGLRLLSLAEGAEPEWHTDDEVIGLLKQGKNFFDITDVYEEGFSTTAAEKAPAVTYDPPSHQDDVKKLIEDIELDQMKSYLADLSAFNNRYYKVATGEQATQWIIETVQGIIDDAKPTANITVSRFKHSFTQGSIIAKIPGSSNSTSVTIIGAHMDSINLNSPSTGRAPGMDDDGSGSVNLLEAFRVLVNSDFAPSDPVEFHWYAGEEGGLLGSQDIAKSYKSKKVDVKAMLQFDMTAYFKPGTEETIAFIMDFVDSSLTKYVGQLVDEYSLLPHDESSSCDYACSDHASWNKQGYPSAFPFETRFGEDNPKIHSTGDTDKVDGFSWTHTLEYTKIAVAFAYELAI